MGILPASLLALIYTLSLTNPAIAQSSSSLAYTLGNDVTIFIPSCAQSCFISFLDADFPKSICGTSPTLDCLCAHNSTSGFTAGEVALQCIVAEDNVGFCEGETGNSTVSERAYHMCVGKPNAFPNTHSTLAATLIIETSKPSIAQVAPTPSSSTLATSTRKASPSVVSTASLTTAAVSTAPLTTANPTTAPTSSTTTSTGPTVVSSALETSASTAAETQLSSPQIAGIVVAGVGAVALAIGAIAIAACLRRRRRRERERHSGLLPFRLDPSRRKGGSSKGSSEKSFGAPGGTPNGIAAKVPPRVPPRLFTDPNMFSRRSIKPDEIGVAITPETKQPARSSRLLPEKPVLRLHVPTEPMAMKGPPLAPFQMPPYNKESSELPADRSRDSAMTQFEEDNTPYTPYNYAANNANYYDGSYNDVTISPQTAAPTTSAYIWPKASLPRMGEAEDMRRPHEIRKPVQSFSQPLQPDTATSSVYSGRGSLLDSGIGYRNASWRPQRPQQQPQYKAYTPYHQPSSQQLVDTVTDIDSQGESAPEPSLVPAPLRPKSYMNDRRSGELSPVAESPVSYPKIPKLSPTMPYPPPPQPNFYRNRSQDYQRQQPQQRPQPEQQQPYVAPWLQAEKDAARARNQAKLARSEKKEEYAGYKSYGGLPTSMPIQISMQSQHSPRASSAMSTTSTSSSLLEKRRGKEQAANLVLVSTQEETARRRAQPKWHVKEEEEGRSAQDSGWKPQTQGRDLTVKWNTTMMEEDRAELPKTPLWNPELTPKMRNGELYLIVQ